MHLKKYKSILSSSNNLNIYRGFTHGCIYCDSRSKCYQFDHPFEDIEVKEDLVEILRMELNRKRNPVMIGTGSMSDPYMNAEADLKITRSVLEMVYKTNHGISILTKSDLILRDLDIIDKISKKTRFILQMTLTTFDEELAKKIEPNVASTKKRVDVLKQFAELGIDTIVWFCPILPFLNDTILNIDKIIDYCIEAKVKGIIFFGAGLTLRDGNREYFYEKLDELFPTLKNEYIKNYGLMYQCNSKNNKELTAHFRKRCIEAGIMCDNQEIFNYLKKIDNKDSYKQLSIFDLL
ncbi:radical SAM protein [Acholeplasma sp. OttesenSCG-928-E16]|nr:radical SAM protein [Acholeplasma sp. OttesenSCG-928-E16]